MDSKSLRFVNLQSLSLAIAFLIFGWPQSIKAQYNLQVDSVITQVIRGQFTTTSDTIKFVVPPGKVWKIQSAWSSWKTSSPGYGGDPYGRIDLRIQDSEGQILTIANFKNSNSNILGDGTIATSNIFVNSYPADNTGQIWLNEGSQIVFSIRPPTSSGGAGQFYRGFLSALQFSIE